MSFFDECKNNIEQMNAYRMIANTNNSFFLTGKAGTGKSTFLRNICKSVNKNFVILAPTGVAAVNVGGQTIHSFFGLSFGVQGPCNYGTISKERIRTIEKIDTIIIDEISMVRCDIIDVIDRMLRRHRKNSQPFGGVQMVFVGDMFQLTPIITFTDKPILRKFYNSRSYCFYDAKVLDIIKLPKIEFSKVYRQSDPDFIDMLDRFRVGDVQATDLNMLNSRVVDEDIVSTADNGYRITLTTRKNDAAMINESRLASLSAKEYSFKATYEGDCSKCKDVADEDLHLKEGAQVMFIKNNHRNGWANGTIGVVSSISKDKITVILECGQEYEVDKSIWEAIEYEYDEQSKMVIKKVVGRVIQYPLRLAWAITIHKSQSLTFDKVAIDLGNGAFAYGQTYVALSRARSFSGIDLLQYVGSDSVKVSREVLEFASEFNDEKLISSELEIGEAISQFEKSKDYDMSAVTLCTMAKEAMLRNDIQQGYYLMTRVFQYVADDDCLMGLTDWQACENSSKEAMFMNAVRLLYTGRHHDAVSVLNCLLLYKPDKFNAVYHLARAYEFLEDKDHLSDCLADLSNIVKELVNNGIGSSAFRKFNYRRAVTNSLIHGNASGISILALLLQENPAYIKYHTSIRSIIQKYKQYLESEISDDNVIIKAILDESISENAFLEIVLETQKENGIAWRKYRRSLSELEFNMTDDEAKRMGKEFENAIFAD